MLLKLTYLNYIDQQKSIMKKNSNLSEQDLKRLEQRIDKLQISIDQLNGQLNEHIKFIERVYEPLRNPISKIKNFFN